jgi:hypothetical protein
MYVYAEHSGEGGGENRQSLAMNQRQNTTCTPPLSQDAMVLSRNSLLNIHQCSRILIL